MKACTPSDHHAGAALSPRCRAALTLTLACVLLFGLLLARSTTPADAQTPPALPPHSGPIEPKVAPKKDDAGIYTQAWFANSFLDLKEEHAETKARGKRLAVVFEQRGCHYCIKMHTDVLAQRYINDYVRENFTVIQLDLWGSREVTDFDGTRLPEKKLAERWGVLFTPSVVFFHEDIAGRGAAWGQPLEVARMQLGIAADTFYDMFTWVRVKAYEQDRNFQRFHISRRQEREAAPK